jgi:hypothetical protein
MMSLAGYGGVLAWAGDRRPRHRWMMAEEFDQTLLHKA